MAKIRAFLFGYKEGQAYHISFFGNGRFFLGSGD